MNDFLTDLYYYIVELTPAICNDPEYEQALQTYVELEEEVKEKIGDELLYKYLCAESDVSHRQDVAVFAQTLRFSYCFLLEILR